MTLLCAAFFRWVPLSPAHSRVVVFPERANLLNLPMHSSSAPFRPLAFSVLYALKSVFCALSTGLQEFFLVGIFFLEGLAFYALA